MEKQSPWVKDKHSKKNFKYVHKMNENKNITFQNMWDAAKSVVRRKSVAVSAYSRKEERFKSIP